MAGVGEGWGRAKVRGGREESADTWQLQERGVWYEAWGSSYHGWHLRPHAGLDCILHLDQMANLRSVALVTPVFLPSLAAYLLGWATVAACGGTLPRMACATWGWANAVHPSIFQQHALGEIADALWEAHLSREGYHLLTWFVPQGLRPQGLGARPSPGTRGVQGQWTGRDGLEENKSIDIASYPLAPGWLAANVVGWW
jgi:hypothetical protein